MDTDQVAQRIAEAVFASEDWADDAEAELDISHSPAISYVRIKCDGGSFVAVIFEGQFPPQWMYAAQREERVPMHGPQNPSYPIPGANSPSPAEEGK